MMVERGGSRDLSAARGEAARALRFRSQRCLRERIEQLDCGAGDAEDLTATTTQGDPGFERGDAFGVQPFDQRLRQVGWQCMRHAGQSSQFASFAKRKLTLISRQLLIQRWTSQKRGGLAPTEECGHGSGTRVDFLLAVVVVNGGSDERRNAASIHVDARPGSVTH
jgi:hypothetical protein